MHRKYQNPVEGSLSYEGITYKSPETDEEWMTTLLSGDLLFYNDTMEVWIHNGNVIITANEVEEVFS